MGTCTSCNAASPTAASSTATAKLVLPDGRLQEHAAPVRASRVLQKQPDCFICSADEMEFDGYLSAMGPERDLRPGRLYFVLPNPMLRRRMIPEDMAALAVRASSALVKSGSAAIEFCGGEEAYAHKRGEVVPAAGRGGSEVETGVREAAVGEARKRRRRTRSGGSGRGRDFSSDLSAIPELGVFMEEEKRKMEMEQAQALSGRCHEE